ncbi:MAG: family lipase [Parcubacteria group bacterium]|nr:family lipase [Parcubacteria group bacterium]
MKYVLIVLALAVLLAGGFLLWQRIHAPHAISCSDMSPRPTIVAFGDSLVAGYGAPDGQGFVDDLATQIGVPIQNMGISGNTTADGLARIDTVLAAKPDVVIVLFGGNDALQKVPQSETRANLDAILAKLTQANIRVVLVGVQGALLSDPYASMFNSLASKYHTEFASNILSGLIGHSDLMSDEVHPNALGYQKIAARLVLPLQKSCRVSA